MLITLFRKFSWMIARLCLLIIGREASSQLVGMTLNGRLCAELYPTVSSVLLVAINLWAQKINNSVAQQIIVWLLTNKMSFRLRFVGDLEISLEMNVWLVQVLRI